MAEEDGLGMNNDESEDACEDDDGSGESEDSFINDEEILGRRSDYLEAKQLEISENLRKILTHVESLTADQYERIGLTFAYSNKVDLLK